MFTNTTSPNVTSGHISWNKGRLICTHRKVVGGSHWLGSRRLLLAYGLHTLLEWMDDKYPLLRQKLPSRQRLFNDIRALTTYLCFDSWDALLVFMLSGFSHPPPKPKTG